jgi:hypothetical protein
VLANASSLLTLNPIIVYATLALYGVLFVVVFAYLYSRFRTANRALKTLSTEWSAAESRHLGLFETAHQSLESLSRRPAPAPKTEVPVRAPVSIDTRTQVIAMAKHGLPVLDIARSCGLAEGEVDVLLGMARMER